MIDEAWGPIQKKSSEGLGAESVKLWLMKAGADSVKKIKMETFKIQPQKSNSQVTFINQGWTL